MFTWAKRLVGQNQEANILATASTRGSPQPSPIPTAAEDANKPPPILEVL
jgi:hypothetical protein